MAGAALAPVATCSRVADWSASGACRSWLDSHAQIRRLLLHWGDVEARLVKEHGWYRLTDAERLVHPGQAWLPEIDQRIAQLTHARDELFPAIVDAKAQSSATLALKLKVAAQLVNAEDCPEGHTLIASLLRDLGA